MEIGNDAIFLILVIFLACVRALGYTLQAEKMGAFFILTNGCLRSFFLQDYPVFQLVFGVRDATNPAVAVVNRRRAEFPDRDVALVIDARIRGGR